jgi:aspartyl-tRNA(Asn)/glutamyl-tRNA(Gln) amidotransferase subunit C
MLDRPAAKSAFSHLSENDMSVDLTTVKRVAHLARIAVCEEQAEKMTGELNVILGFVQSLDAVNVDGVEPMTSVIPTAMRLREDTVSDGNMAAEIVSNAPISEENFFMVPKVIE